MGTTTEDIYKLTSKTDDSGIKQAEKSVSGLGKALQTVGKIGAAPFNAIKNGISGIGKVVGAVGKGLAVFGLAVKGLQDIGRLIGGAFDALRKQSPQLDASLTMVQEKLGKVLGPAMKKLGDALVPVIAKLMEIISSPEFGKFVDTITTGLINGINTLMPLLEKVVSFVGKLFNAISTGDWSEVWGSIRKIAEDAWNAFVAWLGPAWNTFWTVTVPAVWEEFKRIFTMAWDIFWSVTVPAAWNTFKQVFQLAWDGFWTGIKNFAQGIWDGIKLAWDNFWGGLSKGVQSAVDWLKGQGNAISGSASGIVGGVARSNGVPMPGMGGIPKLASGGIVRSPVMAVVGDSPRNKGGEVVSPLSDLMGMIQQAIGGGGITVNVNGPFGPGYTPAQAGAQAGDAIVNKMRNRGLIA